jgi:hypothetical protein
MKYYLSFFLILLIFYNIHAQTQPNEKSEYPKTIEEKTANMEKYEGYFTFYWDVINGKVLLEIDKWDTEFLYVNSLATGVGSNDIGLDRGQLGRERVVKFWRSGPQILLVQPNYSFRAITDNLDEQRAVEEAFAKSVLWGFQVTAEEDNRVLVDASDFYLRDAHDVIGTLKQTEQGEYTLNPSRSAFYLPGTKNFTQNTEVEVMLTFTGKSPGSFVWQVVPTPEAITVRQHHSFIQLPDNNYEPREFDPRAGFFGIRYIDFATPISEPILKRFIARHRLKKQDPNDVISEPVKPIIYYVDTGTPEPIRSALIEGAEWWNQAFESAGYKNAFQVKLLPEGADLMDIRYNVIQWVHRSTRGWSYGSTIMDPRTGEIIKGHISLGSLRVRQDFLIAEGLLAPYETGKEVSREMQEMALARLRQLSAHEVGHTLGLAHNFAASVSNRASVMDYPHPLVKINDDGSFDLSEVYDQGIGEWDKVTIAYGYKDFPETADEKKDLNDIIQNGISQGLIFISDQDARPKGSAHPLAHLWDNGKNPIDELEKVLQIRSLAISRFSENNIREGAPMATLEEALVPIFMFHRYQLEATAKLLAGLYYTYAVRGDGQKISEIVPPKDQLRALDALLHTLQPDVLAVPEYILQQIPPRAFGYARNNEVFKVRTRLTFDPLAAAETAANLTITLILQPERAARLVEYNSRDHSYPGFTEVVDKIIQSTWKSSHGTGYHGEIQRVVDNVVLYHLISLAANKDATSQVRAIAFLKLDELKNWMIENNEATEKDENQHAHYVFAIYQITQFQDNPGQNHFTLPIEPPAGSPIGSERYNSDPMRWGCEWQ